MKAKKNIGTGLAFLAAFVVFTGLLQTVDVKPLGVNGTNIGFSAINCAFHKLWGVNMTLYTVTDWLGLVPIFTAAAFGLVGLIQLVKRRSILKVDGDILILGIHYLLVAVLYAVFELVPINYRPVLIHGAMEVSYPSSTTLLVLGIMPTLSEQISRRCHNNAVKKTVKIFTLLFSFFMVLGRLLSGVHWLTDIMGSILVSVGLFYLYKGLVLTFSKEE